MLIAFDKWKIGYDHIKPSQDPINHSYGIPHIREMARSKRNQKAIQDRTAKRRKQEDAQLLNGAFQEASEILGDETNEGAFVDKPSSWENEEQDYEMIPRKLPNYGEDMVEGLPIKVNGRIERKMRQKQRAIDDDKENEGSGSESDELADSQKLTIKEDHEDLSDEEPDTEAKIIALKEDIADLVDKIIEDPEENTAALSRLCKMAESKNINTSKFSLLALVPTFKSIIPGYRIRPLTDLEKKEKVSKEVARLRNFEQNLIVNYKKYLNNITNLSRTPNSEESLKVSLGVLATQAASELASTVVHFNFRDEIITILVRRICKPNISNDPIAAQTIKTLETLLNDDDEGNVSLSILRILAKTIKVRKYNVDESVLNMLLSLETLQDYDPNTKAEDQPAKMKQRKQDRVHLSKKQRKARKEMKAIEEEMQKAEQTVSAEEKERNQAEILKVMLSLYLNILRIDSPTLVGSVLEGLVKFGNMANLDLLGDFLEVMKEMIQNTVDQDLTSANVRKLLLCIVSAFSLVTSHTQMKVYTDLSVFVDALYAILPAVSLDADLELSHKSLRLADPLNNEVMKPSVNVSTKAELLLKALDHVFFRSRSGSKTKALAFTKRIYMCMGNTPENTTIALLKFLQKLGNRYPEIEGLYSTEDRIGNGGFLMEMNAPLRSNPETAVLWEHIILRTHYCPTIVKGINSLANRSKG